MNGRAGSIDGREDAVVQQEPMDLSGGIDVLAHHLAATVDGLDDSHVAPGTSMVVKVPLGPAGSRGSILAASVYGRRSGHGCRCPGPSVDRALGDIDRGEDARLVQQIALDRVRGIVGHRAVGADDLPAIVDLVRPTWRWRRGHRWA